MVAISSSSSSSSSSLPPLQLWKIQKGTFLLDNVKKVESVMVLIFPNGVFNNLKQTIPYRILVSNFSEIGILVWMYKAIKCFGITYKPQCVASIIWLIIFTYFTTRVFEHTRDSNHSNDKITFTSAYGFSTAPSVTLWHCCPLHPSCIFYSTLQYYLRPVLDTKHKQVYNKKSQGVMAACHL